MMKLRPDDITWDFLSPTGNGKKLNSDMVSYGLSKLCNIWHTTSLHTRLASKGITVNSLHPGMIKTNIQNNSKLLSRFMGIAKPWMKTIVSHPVVLLFLAPS